jgi:putative spermidine/putrescine transport system substrate-binding protein
MTGARWFAALAAASLIVASCGDGSRGSTTGAVDLADWESVTDTAEGQTVNWYMWGGSDSINAFVDTTYGDALSEMGIDLNRVRKRDTVDAVNQVLAEQAAGATDDGGAIDLIWINGENFLTLKQAGMLYDGWAQAIPNSALVDWDNPAVNLDFGEPVGAMESPWSSAQFQFVYDSARTDEADLPRSYAELARWACDNPGRFTYIAPGPGAFQGTRFVKGALFELSGGAEQWAQFDQSLWDRESPALWSYLEDLAPCLWREGEAYPKDENELHALFANGEIDFTITQAAIGPAALIDDGIVPATSRAFVFDDHSIGDFNYVAIPANASNKAAALVLANLLLDPEMQAAHIVPENGFGLGYGIDPNRVADGADREALDGAAARIGDAATPAADLAAALVGDAAGAYQDLVENGWRTNVVGGL